MTSNIAGNKPGAKRLLIEAINGFVFNQLARTSLFRMSFGPPAEHLALIPQDLRTADPSFTTEVYHGHFGLAGAVATTDGVSPFKAVPPNAMWERELHGFGWLRHFNASNSEQAIEQGKMLVKDWIRYCSRRRGVAWEPTIVSRRIISWICHIGPLLEDADGPFYDSVMFSLTNQLHFLSTFLQNIPDGEPRLTALIALNMAGLCIGGQSYLLEQHHGRLRSELNRQILEDGGHITRNPLAPVLLMFDLLPLKQCFVALNRDVPKELLSAIKRISPMIRFMRLGDGYLGRFNGMSATLPDMLATILAYDDYKVTLRGHMPKSGYSRIDQGKTVVLADTGSPVDVSLSQDAHAGCLAFEMTSGIYPVIVNCGAPGPASQDWKLTARTTPFHSTLSINKSSSVRLQSSSFFNKSSSVTFLRGPDNVTAECAATPDEAIINASHDGFVSKYNAIYSRKLILRNEGRLLEGHEHLWPQDDTPSKLKRFSFALHFHVHPDVQVNFAEDRQAVTLTLLNGEVWRFATSNLAPALEESIFLADYRGPRRTLQIVLRGVCNSKAKFVWTLEKIQDEDVENAPATVAVAQTPARLAKLRQKLIFMDPDEGEN